MWSKLAARRRDFQGMLAIDREATMAPQEQMNSTETQNVDKLISTGATITAARISRTLTDTIAKAAAEICPFCEDNVPEDEIHRHWMCNAWTNCRKKDTTPIGK